MLKTFMLSRSLEATNLRHLLGQYQRCPKTSKPMLIGQAFEDAGVRQGLSLHHHRG